MTPLRYFFTVPPINTHQLLIAGIGIQERMRAGIVDRPKGTGDYLFMYFYEAVEIRGADGTLRRAPGSIVVWEPKDGHYYGDKSQEWNHSWMHCSGTYFKTVLRQEHIPCNLPIELPDPAIVEKYLFDLHCELNHYKEPDVMIVQNLIRNWMRELARVVRGGGRKQMIPREFQELKSFIDANYQRNLSLNDLARHIHLSVPHLCSQFKKIFGVPAMSYLIDQRLYQAAHLLHDRNLRVSDVARQVGYDDLFYFSKLFKSRFGASPREFRRRQFAARLDD
jgi:AraC family transcriptional regulator of arabinose operon